MHSPPSRSKKVEVSGVTDTRLSIISPELYTKRRMTAGLQRPLARRTYSLVISLRSYGPKPQLSSSSEL